MRLTIVRGKSGRISVSRLWLGPSRLPASATVLAQLTERTGPLRQDPPAHIFEPRVLAFHRSKRLASSLVALRPVRLGDFFRPAFFFAARVFVGLFFATGLSDRDSAHASRLAGAESVSLHGRDYIGAIENHKHHARAARALMPGARAPRSLPLLRPILVR